MSVINIDETIMKVNRVVDELFYDIVEAYDWNDISETGVYNEDNWRVEELTDEQLKKYMAKKAKLDKVMISTAMQVCHMEDADIKEFAGYARLGKHYVLRALIKLNNMERAKDLELISNDAYYENYGIQEVEEKLKDVETPSDIERIYKFIRDNKLPEKAYFMVDEFVKEKLLKSDELSIEDKLGCIAEIGGREFVKYEYSSGGYYKYNSELLQEIVTRNDEEELWLAKETGDDNLIIQVMIKTNNFDYYEYFEDMPTFVRVLSEHSTDEDFAKVEKVMVEQMPGDYLWFIDCAVDQGLGKNINWELVNNTTIKYIQNLPKDFDEYGLKYVFEIEGFDRERITEAILQNEQICIIEAMDGILDSNNYSKNDRKLIEKLFTAKCADEWTLYNKYAKFNPKSIKKLYEKLLKYREEYQSLAKKDKRTAIEEGLIKQFAQEFKKFEQDHPEVLDQELKQ